jgi:hypothetical protein
MPAASRHAKSRHAKPKPKPAAIRFGAPVGAAAAVASVAAAVAFLHGGSALPGRAGHDLAVSSTEPGVTDGQMITAVHRNAAALEVTRLVRRTRTAARRRHLAAIAAARQTHQRAAAPSPPSPSPSPSPAPSASSPSSGGGDAASSPLGICIRDSEEGGSYAWGPGNGGGAYQFLLGTWEKYGGAASEYGNAGPAYQDQIFDNAIAAGGASNWTAYDGC